ncbi:MAG TPA: aldo/keto reductase [Anaerolineaceae bacterium]
MKYRRLGKTNLKVSVVGIGTWQYGGEWGQSFSQAQVDGILGKAKDLGINLIDTAECYGDHLAETFVGEYIRHDRQSWVVASKFGHKFHANFDRSEWWTPELVRQSLEDSLRALKTDYIDLLQFHSGNNTVFDQPELWKMLAEQVQAGKVRFLGLSISPNDNIYQTARATEVGASVIQVIYNRIDQKPEADVFPSCIAQDLGVLARVPLASGFLSGKYKPGTTFSDPDDVRSRRSPDEIQEKLALVAQIQEKEVPPGVDMASWALAWCLQHPAVTCVIPGCKNIEQVISNARAADLEMVRNDHPQAME